MIYSKKLIQFYGTRNCIIPYMTARQCSTSSATRICPEDRGGIMHIPRSENLKLRTIILVRYCRFHTFKLAAV